MYLKQHEALFTDARYAIVEASTKSGKTVGALMWLQEQAFTNGGEGRHFWWVAPVYKQSKIAYNRCKRSLPTTSYTKNDTDMIITLANGSVMEFKSAEKPDTLYGEDVYAVVLDEASRMREDSWIAVRSTLTFTKGPVRIIGNVKGRRNWAFRMARMAEHGDNPQYHYATINAQDAIDAGILDPEEIEDARGAIPEAAFLELYYNIPSEDGGNPFGLQHIAAIQRDGLSDNPPVVWGWDLARKRDWTVGIALDYQGAVCRLERFQTSWETTFKRIIDVVGNTPALVDQTGVGDPVVERLQAEGNNYKGFMFSGASKQNLMEGLAVAIQQQEIEIPEGSRIVTELEAFEFVHTHNGVRYDAPYVDHDDTVMALAMAVHHKRAMRWLFDAGGLSIHSIEKESHWRGRVA
jgi:hypothetical protein